MGQQAGSCGQRKTTIDKHVVVLCHEVAAYWKIGVCLNEHGDRTLRTEFWPALAL